MMKEIFVSAAWEHEFGSRFEGFIISDREDKVREKVKTVVAGATHDCYWTCEEVKKYFCEEETFNKIKKKTDNEEGIMWDIYLEEYDIFSVEKLVSYRRKYVKKHGETNER